MYKEILFDILDGSLLLEDIHKIKSTSRYQLPVLLNSINYTHDVIRNVIGQIYDYVVSLSNFQAAIKLYLNDKYLITALL